MWHTFALFTQQPSVNWYTEQEIRVWCGCVCVCAFVRAARVRRGGACWGFHTRPRGTRAQERRSVGCPLGLEPVLLPPRTPSKAQPATQRPPPRWGTRLTECVVEWRATQPSASFLLSPRPYTPAPNFNPSPCPFQLPTLPSIKLTVSLSLSLSGTPLSSTMGLHIWQMGSSRLDAKLGFLKRWTQTSAKIPYISPERLDELATASCCPDPSLDPV